MITKQQIRDWPSDFASPYQFSCHLVQCFQNAHNTFFVVEKLFFFHLKKLLFINAWDSCIKTKKDHPGRPPTCPSKKHVAHPPYVPFLQLRTPPRYIFNDSDFF
jgi:hypothetical protein